MRPSTQPIQPRVTADELPRISQKLRLTCKSCGQAHIYDVGTIFCDEEGEGDSAKPYYSFTNYFRCQACNRAGPWEIGRASCRERVYVLV